MPITKVTFNVRLYESEPLDDGSVPIVLQITWRDHKPNVRRKRLGLSCRPDEFDTEYGIVKNSVWGASKRNEQIEEALDKAVHIYHDNFETRQWDYKAWADLFKAEEQKITFDKFANGHIEKLFATNKAGTGIYYRDALKAIQKFMGKEHIPFEEISKNLLRDFEADIISR